jgi:hypothetical protein
MYRKLLQLRPTFGASYVPTMRSAAHNIWAQSCRALGSPATGTCSHSSSSGTKGCIFVPTAVCARQRNGEMHPTHSCASPSDPHFSPRDCQPRSFWDALLVLDYPTRCSLRHGRSCTCIREWQWTLGVMLEVFLSTFTLNTSHCIALRCFAKRQRPVTSV